MARDRSLVWTRVALAMFEDAHDEISERAEGAGDQFSLDVLDAAWHLRQFAEDGAIVPELGRHDVREIFVGRYRLQYRIDADQVAILALPVLPHA